MLNIVKQEQTSAGPPPAYEEGPHKLISDSLYSLIIFIYVSITFLYMFYAFCWRSPDPKPLTEGEKNLPMITEEITAPGDNGDDGHGDDGHGVDGHGDFDGSDIFFCRRRV